MFVYLCVTINYYEMKHVYFLFVVAVMLFSGCDWRKAPNIVDFSKVELDSKSNFVCLVNDVFVGVDSVLQADQTQKIYRKPYVGQEVTCFSFNSDELHFYDGKATAEEIKKVYFIGDYLSTDLNFAMFAFIAMGLFAYYSIASEKEEDEEEEERQKSQQTTKE